MEWSKLENYMNENEIFAYPLYTDPKTRIINHTPKIYSKDNTGKRQEEPIKRWSFYEMHDLRSFIKGLNISEKDNVLALDSIGDASFAMLKEGPKIDLVPQNWIEAILNFEKKIYAGEGNKELFLFPPYAKTNEGFQEVDPSKKRFHMRWQYFNKKNLEIIATNLENLTILPKSKPVEFLQKHDLTKYNKILLNPTKLFEGYSNNYSNELFTTLKEKTNTGTTVYTPHNI